MPEDSQSFVLRWDLGLERASTHDMQITGHLLHGPILKCCFKFDCNDAGWLVGWRIGCVGWVLVGWSPELDMLGGVSGCCALMSSQAG